MGLIVGILCSDGVVVGSDSSRPSLADDPPAAHRPLRKVAVLGGDLVAACTGPVGLGQRFEQVLAELREDSRFHEWSPEVIARSIAAEALDEFARTRGDLRGFGALAGFACASGPRLCQFGMGDLQPEFLGAESWYAAMGPGRAAAESLLALLRRTLFSSGPLRMEHATLAVVWTLRHVIELAPGRAQGPMHVAVLSQGEMETGAAARLLSSGELAEQLERVRAAERHLANYQG